jgi:hypothetical protein
MLRGSRAKGGQTTNHPGFSRGVRYGSARARELTLVARRRHHLDLRLHENGAFSQAACGSAEAYALRERTAEAPAACTGEREMHHELTLAAPASRTVACAPPSFEHTLAMPVRLARKRPCLHDELAIRLTYLAYAVSISAFGVLLGVGLGLLLAARGTRI